MDKQKRKLNYWKLKEAGFTGTEANKLKDRSDNKIKEAIKINEYVKILKLRLFNKGDKLVWQPEQNKENKDTKE
jgi:hypothetical protein